MIQHSRCPSSYPCGLLTNIDSAVVEASRLDSQRHRFSNPDQGQNLNLQLQYFYLMFSRDPKCSVSDPLNRFYVALLYALPLISLEEAYNLKSDPQAQTI